MSTILEKLKDRFMKDRMQPVTKKGLAWFNNYTLLVFIVYVALILSLIYNAMQVVYNVGNLAGFSLAIIPAIILLFEKPIDFIIKTYGIRKVVQDNYTKLINEMLTEAVAVTILALASIVILAWLFGSIIVAEIIGVTPGQQLTIDQQRTIFSAILLLWAMEKGAEIFLNWYISNIKKRIREFDLAKLKDEMAAKLKEKQLVATPIEWPDPRP